MAVRAPAIRRVAATRYVTPLREGGSVPAIMEADDDGLYVVKFRGAGQGPRALIAELIAGEIGRALGLRVPELVLVDLDPVLGRSEPDAEIQDLILASGGVNLGLDYLPGSVGFDAAMPFAVAPDVASDIAWFDAYTTNVDRTARNPNMLIWHRDLWLIDHGAALYFHHDWTGYRERAASPFAPIANHVLLAGADDIAAAGARLTPVLTDDLLTTIVALVPDEWLDDGAPFATLEEHRAAYVEYLVTRRDAAPIFVEEALRARERLL